MREALAADSPNLYAKLLSPLNQLHSVPAAVSCTATSWGSAFYAPCRLPALLARPAQPACLHLAYPRQLNAI
jgi:hypothetical protein